MIDLLACSVGNRGTDLWRRGAALSGKGNDRMRASAKYLAAMIFLALAAQAGNAESIGMTLKRDQVLRSCIGNSEKRCGYLVYLSFRTFPFGSSEEPDGLKPEKFADLEGILAPPLLRSLDISEKLHPGTCPESALAGFVIDAVGDTETTGQSGARIVAVPASLGPCFLSGHQADSEAFLVISDGKVPGYVSCEADYQGAMLCVINLFRVTSRNGIEEEERIEISPLWLPEVIELAGDFPKFPEKPSDALQARFLAALNWMHRMFSTPKPQN